MTSAAAGKETDAVEDEEEVEGDDARDDATSTFGCSSGRFFPEEVEVVETVMGGRVGCCCCGSLGVLGGISLKLRLDELPPLSTFWTKRGENEKEEARLSTALAEARAGVTGEEEDIGDEE